MSDMLTIKTVRAIRGHELNNSGRIGRQNPGVLVLLVCLGCCLLSTVRPLWNLWQWMITVEYYQHVPLMLITAIGLLIWRIWERPDLVQASLSFWAVGWAVIAIVATTCTFVMPSVWLSSVSLFSAVFAAINLFGERGLRHQTVGPVLLLLACIPFPASLDAQLVVTLRQFATWLASLWLDLAGILHLTTGVDILTPRSSYLVEDACSGIHSLFTAIAVGVGYGAFRRYGFWRIVALVLQMVVFVLLTNAVRIFLTVFLQQNGGVDLTAGAFHDLTGVVTFASGLLLAVSSDHLFRFAFRVQPNRANHHKLRGTHDHPWLSALDRPISNRFVFFSVAAIACVGLLAGLLFLRLEYRNFNRAPEDLVETTFLNVNDLNQAFLPRELADWQQIAFESKAVQENDVFGGLRSSTWTYARGTRRAVISVDGPYRNWHDLSVCYRAIGWKEEHRRSLQLGTAAKSLAAVSLQLARPPLEYAHVGFVCVNRDGQSVPPPPYFGETLRKPITWAYYRILDPTPIDGGVVQIQALEQTPIPSTQQQRDQIGELLRAATEHLVKRSAT